MPQNPPTSTCLIWEEIPESNRIFIIPNDQLDDEDHAILALVHGNFINGGEVTPEQSNALSCISNAVCIEAEHLDDAKHPVGSKWAMRFTAFERDHDTSPIREVLVNRIYHSGFVL